jgi:putative addiction module component (TIGR02574 family)
MITEKRFHGQEVCPAMSPNLASVIAAAEALSAAERRELVELLLLGLDDPPTESENGAPVLSEAWRQEIARRSAEYDAGRAKTVTWEEVQARWQARRAADG